MNNYDYIINSFTKEENDIDLEVDNLNVGCITSKNNNFNLDSEGNLTVKSVTAQQGMLSQEAISNFIYPVGSIYISINNVNPSTFFGGTWEQLQDRFLLGAGSSYAGGSTGGEATHLLTEIEMPWHAHSVSLNTSEAGVHSHEIWTTFIGTSHSHYYDPGDALSNGSNNGNKYANPYAVHTAGNHTHSVNGTTTGTGGSGAHNNMPPYLAVYMWKRTA